MVTGLGVTLIIPVIAFLIVRLLRAGARRIEARVLGRKESEDEAHSDRKRRLQTISKMSTASISVLVWTIAIIYLFARLGLDVTPIIASASVVGLAVAFGAQALIRDFFSGFFILIENQFTIGDIVRLGTVSGVVENISLRITVVRDLQGVVHYIPNGSINQVSNMTQGWSRVVLEISVPYSEDPDRISQILGDTLLEMARDEVWRFDILEEPVVAGVENFTERSVDIRIMVKTRPGKQWNVARETRRRIKKKFDELGISIPFPHRVVHHVYEGAEPPGSGGPRAPGDPEMSSVGDDER
jgi:small conductance mechanosensitive channel